MAVCDEHSAIATNVCRGDIHAHSAYSLDANNMSGVESGDPIDDFFIYARDYANLDFVAISDHAEHFTDPNNFADPNFPNSHLDPNYMNYVVNKACPACHLTFHNHNHKN